MLNKTEASEYLGVSTRTIELYMKHPSRPLVPDERVKGRGGEKAMFAATTLDAYKLLMDKDAQSKTVKRETPKSEALSLVRSNAQSNDLAALLSHVIGRGPTKLVTRKQAAEESGLSVSMIEKAVKAGYLREVKGVGKRGASVLRLSDVLQYASSLFDE